MWQKDKHRNSTAYTPAPPGHTTLDKLFILSTSSVINRSQWWMSHNNLTIWSKAAHIKQLGGSCHTASFKSIYVLIISPRKPGLHWEAFLWFPPPLQSVTKITRLDFLIFLGYVLFAVTQSLTVEPKLASDLQSSYLQCWDGRCTTVPDIGFLHNLQY